MNIFNNWTPWLGVGQILFGIVGLLTGWIPSAGAIALIAAGLTTLGVHNSNVQLGIKLGGHF